jgi:hypothetical protein
LSCGQVDDIDDPDPGALDCAEGCTLDAPCELSAERACEFAEPTSWGLFDVEVGEVTEVGARTELLAFPTGYAGKVAPVRLSDGVFDSEFLQSWRQAWSPDGEMLVFDAATAFSSSSPGFDMGVFASEFGGGVPGPARRVEGVSGALLGGLELQPWEPLSRGFLVRAQTELYLVQREGSALAASLVASDYSAHAVVCAGAEHFAYATSEAFVVKSAAGEDVSRIEGRVDNVKSSVDAQWLAVTTVTGEANDERYAVDLVPCGPGQRTRLLADREYASVQGFSQNSRYLVLGHLEGYLELADPRELRLFPEGVGELHAWSPDDSYALLTAADGQLLAFWPDSEEAVPVGSFGVNFEMLGQNLLFRRRDDRAQVVSFELVDPTTPGAIPRVYSAASGSYVSDIDLNDSGTTLAYIEQAADGAAVVMVDLPTERELARFEMHGVVKLALGQFAPDGSGLVAVENQADFSHDPGERPFAVYFLRPGTTPKQSTAAVVSQGGRAGIWRGARPFPSAAQP